MTNDKTIARAVADGDELAGLNALADRLATALDDDPKPHTIAPMARELSRTLARIAELTAVEPEQTIAEALAEARLAHERDGVKRRG